MVQAAKDNDRVLEVSFNHRRRGDVQALKAVVDSGLLGRIYYAKAGWLRREGIPGLGSWFTRAASAGGGPLMDIGVHMLDMALHLMGEPAVRAATAATYAEFGPRGRGGSRTASAKTGAGGGGAFDVEDLSTAFLRLEDGGTLLLESSWAQWIPHDQCYVTLYGSEGGASIEWGGDADHSYHRVTAWTEVQGIPAELQPAVGPNGGHLECVLDFLAVVASGDFKAFSGEEALVRAQVVDACYASAAAGREVTLG
jgi:predicted dehydrogenase